jgi:hypothetical protein
MPKKKELEWLFRDHLELLIQNSEICLNKLDSLHGGSTKQGHDRDEEVASVDDGSAGTDYAIDTITDTVCIVFNLGYLSLISI